MKKNNSFSTVKFFLKEPNSSKETLIYAILNFQNQQLKLSTGKKIHPKNWDAENQKIKRGAIGEKEINERLNFFSTSLNSIYNDLYFNKIKPTKELIKSKFLNNEFFEKKEEKFFEHFDRFVEKYTNNGIRPGLRTIQRYKVLEKKLLDFQKANKIEISFDSINVQFSNDFVHYLLKKKLTNNTVGTYIKNLKLFMKWTFDQDLHKNQDFRKFKVFKKDTFQVSLDDKEMAQIINLDLSNKPHLDKARDLFILQCNLGLRYSDLKRLNESHFNLEEGFVEIISQKTHSYQVIPLSELAIQIIKKYNSNPQFISDQKQNKHIKEICKLSGINNLVTDYKEIGNKLIEELKPKYELITTHTARRTFITKLKMMGLPDDLIKLSTGHKTSTELNKYFRSSLESAKLVYKDLWKI